MAIFTSEDNKELIITCKCGCEESIHITINDEGDMFSFISYMNGNFYKDQIGVFSVLAIKLKKIFAIIRNKDFYYSDIVMTKGDWIKFRGWINSKECL